MFFCGGGRFPLIIISKESKLRSVFWADIQFQALLRPGRFDRILYVPLPDAVTRKEILQIVTRRIPVAPDVSMEELVNRTERYSGAEVSSVFCMLVRKAFIHWKQNMFKVTILLSKCSLNSMCVFCVWLYGHAYVCVVCEKFGLITGKPAVTVQSYPAMWLRPAGSDSFRPVHRQLSKPPLLI